MTQKEIIGNKAVEALRAERDGLRYSDLVRRVGQELPEAKANTIHGTVWNLDVTRPAEVYKPARGLFRHTQFREAEVESDIRLAEGPRKKIAEEEFYESFAEYITTDLEECTKAIALGGNRFKDKWGTPDVVGVLAPKPSDIFKLPPEIVSAEVKNDVSSLITAFGQACSYRLFSHKVYLVIPNSASESDLARLDALCRVFGLGLILFDPANPGEPNFQIRVRATKHEPDMFYANRNLKVIEDELFG